LIKKRFEESFVVCAETKSIKDGYNLERTEETHTSVAWLLLLTMLGFLILMLIFPQIKGEAKSGILFYSVKGLGVMHAPLIVSLLVGLTWLYPA